MENSRAEVMDVEPEKTDEDEKVKEVNVEVVIEEVVRQNKEEFRGSLDVCAELGRSRERKVVREIQKNKEDFWSNLDYSAEPQNRERNHRGGRPRKEKPKRKDQVQRGRVTKRGGESSRRVRVSKNSAPKRKPRPQPKPVRKITSDSSLGMSTVSDSSCCDDCARRERSQSCCSDCARSERSSSCCSDCARRERRLVLSRRRRRRLVEEIVRKMREAESLAAPAVDTAFRIENTQAGSDSKLSSPLLVKVNAQMHSAPVEVEPFMGVTPDMIVEALRHLTMWVQFVPDHYILDYIKRHYPVNPDSEALLSELSIKLTIAATVGFIEKCSVKNVDHWCPKTGLFNRKLMKDHVDLFWKLYADTLKSAIKNPPKPNPSHTEHETNTGAEQNETEEDYEDDEII